MTQENKELLLKDLCARLPYGVKVNNEIQGDFVIYGMCENYVFVRTTNDHADFPIEKIKPYLRPMSSMTEEEFTKLKEYGRLEYDNLDLVSFQNGIYKMLDFYLNGVSSGAVIRLFDWLNKYHFDYRDLIQMGLAIAVTKENNPY